MVLTVIRHIRIENPVATPRDFGHSKRFDARLLASQNPPPAPTLHFCTRVIGDMYIVVMEYIPGSRGSSVDPKAGGPPLPKNLQEVINLGVREALCLLHQKGWVFGDLQEPNLLYLPDRDGGRVLLVDFEAVGPDGEARYSSCLNPNAKLCTSANRGMVMKKAHDYENLQLLLKRLPGRN